VSVLADTHALHWFLTEPGRLSRAALDRLQEAEFDEASGIAVSVASRIDLHYLVASGRLDVEVAAQVWAVTTYPDVNVSAIPVSEAIADLFGDSALTTLRDPWDRLIVATAMRLAVPVVTRDSVITELGVAGVVEVIW